MTQQERDQKYSNLCVQLGDHITKARQHDLAAKKIMLEIEHLLKEPTGEENAKKSEAP